MREITNQTVSIYSNGQGVIILKWPDLQIEMNIENAKKLIEGLQSAVRYEEKT